VRIPRSFLVALLYGAILVGALLSGVQPSVLAFFVLSAAASTWRTRKVRREAEAFWSIVWEARHASTEERARLIGDLPSGKVRRRVEQILAQDGSQEQVGDVERFPFPASLHRHATRLYWIMWVVAVALFSISALSSAPLAFRLIGVGVAAVSAFVAWHASQRETGFRSVLEVTPFRISERLANDVVRTLSWNNYLELRNEPKRSRLLLSTGDEDAIALDYRRMGFARLVELVRTYGRFPAPDSFPPADERYT
jgi:Flp pilus assembly protein TadB